MPYIRQQCRDELDPLIKTFEAVELTPGMLNYTITKLVLQALLKKKAVGYADYAMMTGVLENVKTELYRRVVALYEDKMILSNGEVY